MKEETATDSVVTKRSTDCQCEINWIIESGASHHYSRDSGDLGGCIMEDRTLMTAGSENLLIKQRSTHKNCGAVKAVPEIGRYLFSVGQLTHDSKLTVNFEGK